MQKGHNSIVGALGLLLFCIKPSISCRDLAWYNNYAIIAPYDVPISFNVITPLFLHTPLRVIRRACIVVITS